MGKRRQKLDQHTTVVTEAYCGLKLYAEQGNTDGLHEKVSGSFPIVAFLFPMLINKVIDFLIQWLNNHRQEALELIKEAREP